MAAKTLITIRPGDTIPIQIKGTGTRLPTCYGKVEKVDKTVIHYTYTADSPMFAGLRGMLRASRTGLKWIA